MINHATCRICARSLDCIDLIQLFNSSGLTTAALEAWCPFCVALMAGPDVEAGLKQVVIEANNYACFECAGSAGAGSLSLGIRTLGLAGTIEPIMIGQGFYALSSREHRRYQLHNYYTEGAQVEARRPRPGATGFTLPEGAIRCLCNRCGG